MKVALLFVSICYLVVTTAFAKNFRDTVYIQTSPVDTLSNSFYYYLVFEKEHEKIIVFEQKVDDFAVEFECEFAFNSPAMSCVGFTIYSLPAGMARTVIFDEQAKKFYLTDWYDLHALGDKILPNTVNFKNKSVYVESVEVDGKRIYSVGLKQVWPKL
jgi:hypothetical protein